MEFKNYCIIVMGQTDGILNEVNKISEKILGSMDAKGLVIITFVANSEVGELSDFFKEYKRNFVLFVLDDNVSGYNFLKNDIQNELFGNLQPNELKIMTDKLLKEVKTNEIDKNLIKDKTLKTLTDEELSNLSEDEKEEKINEIIDKGINNLNDYDKDILDKLTKFK